MTDADPFLSEWLAQNDHLREQINALDKKPQVRRRLRLFIMWCKNCSNPLIEVLDTKPYPVVRSRDVQPSPRPPRAPAGSSIKQALEHYQREREASPDLRRQTIRLDRQWRFFAVPEGLRPDGADPSAIVTCACSCMGSRDFRLRWIYEQIANGDTDISC